MNVAAATTSRGTERVAPAGCDGWGGAHRTARVPGLGVPRPEAVLSPRWRPGVTQDPSKASAHSPAPLSHEGCGSGAALLLFLSRSTRHVLV